MNKILRLVMPCILLAGLSFTGRATTILPDQAPSLKTSVTSLRNGTGANTIQRLFDIQFNHNASAQRPNTSLGGVVWTGTEFWVSKWSGDSLFTFDINGMLTSSFKVAGVGSSSSGVRGMTFDGTYIYAGANSTSIYQINPATKTLVSTIAAPLAVRGIAFDSTANAGAGGFWISNFNTDIILVSRSGATLSSITAASHGLTGMYGLAYDPYTNGGPYLWAFDQNTSSDRSDLVRIDIAAGGPDGIKHNVMLDVGQVDGGVSGLAGGLQITWGLDPSGHRTILGLLQGTPNIRLFGYELNDFVPAVIDAAADTLSFNPAFTYVPKFLSGPVNWNMDVTNLGSAAIDTLRLVVNVDSAGVQLFSDTGSYLNLAPSATANITHSNSFTPAEIGAYQVMSFLNTGLQLDEINVNDTIRYTMNVTDTVLGKDNNTVQGSLGIGNGSGGLLGQKFVTPGLSYASSASFYLRSPAMNDTVRAELYTFSGTPGTQLAISATYIITAADTDGVQLTLPFPNLIMLPAGEYFLAIREYSSNITLGTTRFNFRPAEAYYKIGTGNWTRAETGNFRITYLLRLNVQDPVLVNVPHLAAEGIGMYPNPAADYINIRLQKADDKALLIIHKMSGQEVYRKQGLLQMNTIPVADLPAGIYMVSVSSGEKTSAGRISIIR